jgi:hypothetical protein
VFCVAEEFEALARRGHHSVADDAHDSTNDASINKNSCGKASIDK